MTETQDEKQGAKKPTTAAKAKHQDPTPAECRREYSRFIRTGQPKPGWEYSPSFFNRARKREGSNA